MATKKELQKRYTELYGETPEERVTVKELTALIAEKESEESETEQPDFQEPVSVEETNLTEVEDAESIEEPINAPESTAEVLYDAEVVEKPAEKVFVENGHLLKKVEGKKEKGGKTYFYGELR